MIKFRDGMMGSTVILFLICFIITFVLAAVYNITAPIIAQGEIVSANNMRKQVLPQGDSFTKLELILPDGISEVYKADNGSGFVFTSEAKGFGGAVVYMIGISPDGHVVGIQNFSHNETPGLGTKIFEPSYIEQFHGNTEPDSVDAVTGATRTSNSLKNSIKQVLEAYDAVKEAV